MSLSESSWSKSGLLTRAGETGGGEVVRGAC
jgi:hypothetical protein